MTTLPTWWPAVALLVTYVALFTLGWGYGAASEMGRARRDAKAKSIEQELDRDMDRYSSKGDDP